MNSDLIIAVLLFGNAIQFAMIFALVNRLLIQHKLPKISPLTATEAAFQSLKATPSSEKVEHPEPAVLERFKVTS